MKLEKPKSPPPETWHTQPWQERDTRGAEEETNRMKKRADEVDALNQTLEQLRTSQAFRSSR